MKHDEFIGQVQQRARLSSRGETERATWATLQTLGERLAGGEAKDFASQLPPQLAQYALSGLAGLGAPISIDDFCLLISAREGVDMPQAVLHARAVISVLQEAISQGEVENIRSQLPNDYNRFFEIGSEARI